MYVYSGAGWQAAGSSVNGTSDRQTYTASAGQTVFAATYDTGYIDVYLNGVKLVAGTDFTATNGTSITLASGATINDVIDIVAYGTFVLADHYTEAQSDARFVNVTGDTMTGNLATAYSLAAFNITPKSTSGYSLQFGSGPSDFPYIQMSAGGAASGNLLIQPYGGNVGIGTAPSVTLHVKSPNPVFGLETTGTVSAGGTVYSELKDSTGTVFTSGFAGLANCYQFSTTAAAGFMRFLTGAQAEALRIDASGRVGIGRTPTISNSKLEVGGADNVSLINVEASGVTGGMGIGSTGLQFFHGSTARMRIDSIGGLVWHQSPSSSASGIKFENTVHPSITVSGGADTAFRHRIIFVNGNGTVGIISTNGSATTYATSSDYRLKENVVPMTGSIDRVKALKPSRFNFIVDADKTVDGFLAHEAQAVVPECVTGTKDAMRDEDYEVTAAVYEDIIIAAVLDEEGNELEAERTEQRLVSEAVMGTRSVPDYQGIDQSKLVPLLTAALQEALNKIDAMEIRLAALENN
jgi:hypothetical protein